MPGDKPERPSKKKAEEWLQNRSGSESENEEEQYQAARTTAIVREQSQSRQQSSNIYQSTTVNRQPSPDPFSDANRRVIFERSQPNRRQISNKQQFDFSNPQPRQDVQPKRQPVSTKRRRQLPDNQPTLESLWFPDTVKRRQISNNQPTLESLWFPDPQPSQDNKPSQVSQAATVNPQQQISDNKPASENSWFFDFLNPEQSKDKKPAPESLWSFDPSNLQPRGFTPVSPSKYHKPLFAASRPQISHRNNSPRHRSPLRLTEKEEAFVHGYDNPVEEAEEVLEEEDEPKQISNHGPPYVKWQNLNGWTEEERRLRKNYFNRQYARNMTPVQRERKNARRRVANMTEEQIQRARAYERSRYITAAERREFAQILNELAEQGNNTEFEQPLDEQDEQDEQSGSKSDDEQEGNH